MSPLALCGAACFHQTSACLRFASRRLFFSVTLLLLLLRFLSRSALTAAGGRFCLQHLAAKISLLSSRGDKAMSQTKALITLLLNQYQGEKFSISAAALTRQL